MNTDFSGKAEGDARASRQMPRPSRDLGRPARAELFPTALSLSPTIHLALQNGELLRLFTVKGVSP